MRMLSVSIFLTAGLLIGCGGSTSKDSEGVRISFGRLTALSNLSYSGITEPQVITINSEAQLDAAWANYTAGMPSPPAKPAIHFSEQTLIAFFPGALPTPCDSLVIESVKDAGTETDIYYRIDPPKPNVSCIQVIVYPSEWLVINKTTDSIKAIKRI